MIAILASAKGSGLHAAVSNALDSTGADLLLAHASWYNAITPNPALSDSKGNAGWTPLTKRTSGTLSTQWFYCKPTSVGSGHTASFAGSTVAAAINFFAISGSDASPFLDEDFAAGTSVNSISAGSKTPSEDNCLVVAGLGVQTHNGAISINGGFSTPESIAWASGVNQGVSASRLIQTTAALASPSWALTNNASVAIGSLCIFKPSSGPDAITIATPVEMETYQRGEDDTADLEIAGFVTGTATAIEASINGTDWITLDASPTTTYSGTFPNVPKGEYTITVRWANDHDITASVDMVGVGDVFLCTGQSHMSGRWTNHQVYSHATLTARILGNDDVWKELVDPTDSAVGQVDAVSSDVAPTAAAGSFLGPLATLIMAHTSCPVAFIPCAKGQLGIEDWVTFGTPATLSGSMVRRANLVRGLPPKANLYWGMETNALNQDSQAEVFGYIEDYVDGLWTACAIPTMFARIETQPGVPSVDADRIRAAIDQAVSEVAHVLEGPDFEDKTTDDIYHFVTDASAQGFVPERWFAAMQAAGLFGSSGAVRQMLAHGLFVGNL